MGILNVAAPPPIQKGAHTAIKPTIKVLESWRPRIINYVGPSLLIDIMIDDLKLLRFWKSRAASGVWLEKIGLAFLTKGNSFQNFTNNKGGTWKDLVIT